MNVPIKLKTFGLCHVFALKKLIKACPQKKCRKLKPIRGPRMLNRGGLIPEMTLTSVYKLSQTRSLWAASNVNAARWNVYTLAHVYSCL